MKHQHILVLTFPTQGHINPSIQFAKRLLLMGVEVTLATSLYACGRMAKITTSMPTGLKLAAFSDGYDNGFNPNLDSATHYMSEVKNHGPNTLREIIIANAKEGCPITCLVYSLLMPWAKEVAREFNIPSALLWIQPATVLDIYYYYFHGYAGAIKNICHDNKCSIELPNVPVLITSSDLPSFMLPSISEDFSFALPTFKEIIDSLDAEAKPIVLVNTFDALESEALKAIGEYNLIPVGPLIPSAFLDGKHPSDSSFGGDLFENSRDYVTWLNSKPELSVVYVSFGSVLVLQKKQMEEIAKALLEIKRPFLWVIKGYGDGNRENEEEKLSCIDELEKEGRIVPWCSQIEVLSNPSLGCFVTHCGWNSTLESLVSGVPAVAFPHWTDQGTNAKLIEDVWKTGVRVKANEECIVESDELKRCIELTMSSEELRRNAKVWKDLARESMMDGGSSEKNLMAFAEKVGQGC